MRESRTTREVSPWKKRKPTQEKEVEKKEVQCSAPRLEEVITPGGRDAPMSKMGSDIVREREHHKTALEKEAQLTYNS